MNIPKIRELRVRAVRVPMEQPHQTASGTISESPLVLTDVTTDDGTVGRSMIFTYAVAALKPAADLIKNLESFIKDEPLAPTAIADKLSKRFRLGSSYRKESLESFPSPCFSQWWGEHSGCMHSDCKGNHLLAPVVKKGLSAAAASE